MRLVIAAALLVPLGACTTVPSDPIVGEPGGACNNGALASFTGQPATAELGAQMLRQSGATKLRWVAKGMMVTMDFRSDRVTAYLDAANRVERASCG